MRKYSHISNTDTSSIDLPRALGQSSWISTSDGSPITTPNKYVSSYEEDLFLLLLVITCILVTISIFKNNPPNK